MLKRKLCNLLFCAALLTGTAYAQTAAPSALLQVLQEEMDRSLQGIKAKGEVPCWFLSYTVTEVSSQTLEGELGAILHNINSRQRLLDIEMRVGNRPGEARNSAFPDFGGLVHLELPLDDNVDAIRRAIWLATDSRYRTAQRELGLEEARQALEPDPLKRVLFSLEPAQHYLGDLVPQDQVHPEAEERVRQLSAAFKKYPRILASRVLWRSENINRYQVTSEGTRLQLGSRRQIFGVEGSTRAEDGMVLSKYDNIGKGGEDLPSEAEALPTVLKVADDLMRLRAAPIMDSYAGPAIFSGRAAAVFFHENLGHRVEGSRQDDLTQGHTFTNKLNRAIMPSFISVVDDPTLTRFGDVELNGHYLFDDEGIPAQKVSLINHGVLKNFLLSRSLVGGFTKSNGHGRKSPGFGVAARQGNLIVESSQTVSDAALKRMMIEECRRQNKPFGLYFDQVSGGSTFVGGGQPQIYQVHPLLVYRVYVDGRPDQLVRGVEIIGTPLAAFLNIKACGDHQELFNGICGAESGLVPVAAAAPPMLISQIETQKESWQPHRPPLLPAPEADSGVKSLEK